MSLLISLGAIPRRLLDTVERLTQQNRAKAAAGVDTSKVKNATRPRAQRSRFATSSILYKRPEPAPPIQDGLELAGLSLAVNPMGYPDFYTSARIEFNVYKAILNPPYVQEQVGVEDELYYFRPRRFAEEPLSARKNDTLNFFDVTTSPFEEMSGSNADLFLDFVAANDEENTTVESLSELDRAILETALAWTGDFNLDQHVADNPGSNLKGLKEYVMNAYSKKVTLGGPPGWINNPGSLGAGYDVIGPTWEPSAALGGALKDGGGIGWDIGAGQYDNILWSFSSDLYGTVYRTSQHVVGYGYSFTTDQNFWDRWFVTLLPAGGTSVVLVWAYRSIRYGALTADEGPSEQIINAPPGYVPMGPPKVTHRLYAESQGAQYGALYIDTARQTYKHIHWGDADQTPAKVKENIDAFMPGLSDYKEYQTNFGGFPNIKLPTPEAYIQQGEQNRRYSLVLPAAQQMAMGWGLGAFKSNYHYPSDSNSTGGPYWGAYGDRETSIPNFITPGNFSYFNGTLSFDSSTEASYEAVKEAFPADVPLPDTFVSIDNLGSEGKSPYHQEPISVAGSTINFDLRKAVSYIPQPVGAVTTPVSPNLATPETSVEVPPIAYNMWVWDWGQPEYCVAQLLDLGFTEADLRPPTEQDLAWYLE